MSESKDLFDNIPSKTAFWIGFATAILSIGFVGFILLGSCMLTNKCSGIKLGGDDTGSAAPIAVNNPAPTPDAAAPAPTGTVPAVTKDDHVKGGDASAPVTMIEYSDFQCPYCGAFEPTVAQVLKQYGNKIRFVYRHFPLSFHPNAEPAALASECASEQGKFWQIRLHMRLCFLRSEERLRETRSVLVAKLIFGIKKGEDWFHVELG